MGDFEASFRSVVRGFHVYRAVWTPVLHEELTTQLTQRTDMQCALHVDFRSI